MCIMGGGQDKTIYIHICMYIPNICDADCLNMHVYVRFQIYDPLHALLMQRGGTISKASSKFKIRFNTSASTLYVYYVKLYI